MKVQPRIRLSARARTSVSARARVLPRSMRTSLRAFTSRLIGPIQGFFEYLSYRSPVSVRIRPPTGWPCYIEGDVPDRSREDLFTRCRMQLENVPGDSATLFALELLAFLTPEGYIRESDEDLHRQTGIPMEEIRRARRRLQTICGVGWMHMFEYLADQSEDPVLHRLAVRVTEVLRNASRLPVEEAEQQVQQVLIEWITADPSHAQHLQQAMQRFGTRPVAEPSAPPAVRRFVIPDVMIIDQDGVLEPIVYVPGLTTPTGRETATLILQETGFQRPELAIAHFQKMAALRKRLLWKACQMAIRVNGPWIRGETRIRRWVGFQPKRYHIGVLHALCLLPDRTIEPMWYLLGWDYTRTRRRLIPMPMRDIRRELRAMLQIRPEMTLREMQHFVRQQFNVDLSISTLSRLRKSLREGENAPHTP